MRLDQIERDWNPRFIHNPKHFYPNSFEIEVTGPRVILVGRVKRHLRKGYRKVAVLKKRR